MNFFLNRLTGKRHLRQIIVTTNHCTIKSGVRPAYNSEPDVRIHLELQTNKLARGTFKTSDARQCQTQRERESGGKNVDVLNCAYGLHYVGHPMFCFMQPFR